MKLKQLFSIVIAITLIATATLTTQGIVDVLADDEAEDYVIDERSLEEILEEQALIREEYFNKQPETNSLPNWPEGPLVQARSAILMEVSTGAVLYAKDIYERRYPASITKLVTTLVALENSEFTDDVEITEESVNWLQWNYAHIGMQAGEIISMEDALHANLLASANEVSYAIAENVGNMVDGGGYSTFIRMMNEKTSRIGAANSSWENPHGLHGDNHFTTAYDMALIISYLYENPDFLRLMRSLRYTIEETNIVEEERVLYQDHQMLRPEGCFHYPMANSGKTGFTDQAGTTLATTADNGEFSLVAVVLFDHGWQAYESTIAMMDYGFENFSKIRISEDETDEHIESFVEPDSYIMLPNNIDLGEVSRTITILEENVAEVVYSYHGHRLGSAEVIVSEAYLAYLERLEHLDYLADQAYNEGVAEIREDGLTMLVVMPNEDYELSVRGNGFKSFIPRVLAISLGVLVGVTIILIIIGKRQAKEERKRGKKQHRRRRKKRSG